jgi:hypothetical protein
MNKDLMNKHLGRLLGAVKAVPQATGREEQTIAYLAPDGLYNAQFPSSLIIKGFVPEGWAKRKGDLP